MNELKIEYLPIGDLKPYEKNAKKHEDADVQTIVASIKEFGFDDPIGVWGEENLIVEGHGRLLAAKKFGMETVPVIRLDHLTDEQRRAYVLAHNKTAENSEWDFDILPDELESIVDIDMTQFGFEISSEEIDETDLDNLEEKTNVIVTLNCGDHSNYEQIKERLQNLADEVGANLSIKMQ